MIKIVYAIQGTGNGHVARAREIVPLLQKWGEVHVVLSGDQSEVELPFKVHYRVSGLTFIYNRKGGISYGQTLLKNNLYRIWKEIINFPIKQYDYVINDFEFITAWACRLRKKPCIALGHQASFHYAATPRPARKSLLGEFILKNYAPASRYVGFHFHYFAQGIYKPVIRREIREAKSKTKEHYTVYMPAFGDEELYNLLRGIDEVRWQVFSKFAERPYRKGNVYFKPIDNTHFLESFITCKGILTSAGFETPAEALYMGKKLFVIPIKGQYEQHCNAAALKALKVPQAQGIHDKTLHLLQDWVYNQKAVHIDFPYEIEQILEGEIGWRRHM